MSNVFHGLTVASWTPQRGHPAGILPAAFRCADGHIHDRFIEGSEYDWNRKVGETPRAHPSCSQAIVLSSSAASNPCITPRKADGAHPTGVARGSRAKNSLIVSRPPRV